MYRSSKNAKIKKKLVDQNTQQDFSHFPKFSVTNTKQKSLTIDEKSCLQIIQGDSRTLVKTAPNIFYPYETDSNGDNGS